MRLTGPTGAVELVRWKWARWTHAQAHGQLTACGQYETRRKDTRFSASRADIRLGFVRVCPECRATLEVRDGESLPGR